MLLPDREKKEKNIPPTEFFKSIESNGSKKWKIFVGCKVSTTFRYLFSFDKYYIKLPYNKVMY